MLDFAVNHTMASGMVTLQIDDLKPGSKYVLRVHVRNDVGLSVRGTRFDITTLDAQV